MDEKLVKFLLEDLGRSFVTVPFRVYSHVCSVTREEVGKRYPAMKLRPLTDPEIRVMYARYCFWAEDNCVEFLKSVITGYPDLKWPSEVDKLIRMSLNDTKRRREEVASKLPTKKQKLVDYEDDICSIIAGSLTASPTDDKEMTELDDDAVLGLNTGKTSPLDFKIFHNPEPPETDSAVPAVKQPLATEVNALPPQETVNLQLFLDSPSPGPLVSAKKVDASQARRFLDPRLAKRLKNHRSSGSSGPPSIEDSESVKSFISEVELTEEAGKAMTEMTSIPWKLYRIAGCQKVRYDVTGLHPDDPRDASRGCPTISGKGNLRDGLTQENVEVSSAVGYAENRRSSTETLVCESNNFNGKEDEKVLKWRLTITPNGSPASYLDDEEDSVQEIAVIEDESSEEGEEIDAKNFHEAFTRPTWKQEGKCQPTSGEVRRGMEDLDKLDLSQLNKIQQAIIENLDPVNPSSKCSSPVGPPVKHPSLPSMHQSPSKPLSPASQPFGSQPKVVSLPPPNLSSSKPSAPPPPKIGLVARGSTTPDSIKGFHSPTKSSPGFSSDGEAWLGKMSAPKMNGGVPRQCFPQLSGDYSSPTGSIAGAREVPHYRPPEVEVQISQPLPSLDRSAVNPFATQLPLGLNNFQPPAPHPMPFHTMVNTNSLNGFENYPRSSIPGFVRFPPPDRRDGHVPMRFPHMAPFPPVGPPLGGPPFGPNPFFS